MARRLFLFSIINQRDAVDPLSLLFLRFHGVGFMGDNLYSTSSGPFKCEM